MNRRTRQTLRSAEIFNAASDADRRMLGDPTSAGAYLRYREFERSRREKPARARINWPFSLLIALILGGLVAIGGAEALVPLIDILP